MRKLLTILATGALLTLGAGAALAQPPISGTWKSSNGDFLEGRSATSWSGMTSRLMPGNILNIESYDPAGGGGPIASPAAVLGSQWRVYCMQMVNATLIADLTFGTGNGSKIYLITYVGGFFELSGTGPWGGGAASYTGVVDTYNETRTIQFVGGNITGANSNHNVSGHMPGFNIGCITLAVGNGVLIGDTDPNLIPVTDTNVKPADYPDFLDMGCNPTGTFGRWGDINGITLTVSGCTVPVEEKTWGGVKKLYQE